MLTSVSLSSTPAHVGLAPPPPVHCVCIARSEPRWTTLAVGLQTAMDGDVRLTWLSNLPEVVRLLQATSCDVVILGDDARSATGETADSLRGLMSLLGDVPLVAVTPLPNEEWVRDVTEIGVTVCVSPRLWDSPALPALVISAIQRAQQQAEWRRLDTEHQRRKSLDLADARALLQLQQQTLLRIQERSGIQTSATAPATWQSRYRELLRVSLITGLPGLIAEIQRFVQQLAVDGVSPTDVLTTHIAETERLLEGLGGRSSRQVASRATLLAVETLAELAEQYRQSARLD